MPVSAAQRRANDKHDKVNFETFTVKARIGKRQEIKSYVDTIGETFNGFVLRAIDEAMQKDNGDTVTANE